MMTMMMMMMVMMMMRVRMMRMTGAEKRYESQWEFPGVRVRSITSRRGVPQEGEGDKRRHDPER
eukprot:8473793-Karenia_brevis.AAC.1